MRRHAVRLVLASLLLAAPPPLAAAPEKAAPGHAPVCRVASHDRLLVRSGRDICAPTLNRNGKPAAAGFLPTECPRSSETYTIDAAGTADRCLVPARKEK